MYDFLRGEIVSRHPAGVTLDVGGIGFRLEMPRTSLEKVPRSGTATLFVHHYVREDEQRLFAFATPTEREAFRLLLTLNGVGPSLSLQILSQVEVAELAKAIAREDTGFLASLKGIGRKTAQRMVIELREPFVRLSGEVGEALGGGSVLEDAVRALVSLGYRRGPATQAVDRAWRQGSQNGQWNLEDLVKEALQHVTA